MKELIGAIYIYTSSSSFDVFTQVRAKATNTACLIPEITFIIWDWKKLEIENL